MIRSLLKIAALLIAGILVYNYFFGTNEEQENSRKVFGQIRGVVSSVGQLVSSEKDKFDAGKYDAVLDKLGGVYKAIRTQARHMDEKVIKRLDGLEARKVELEQELSEIEAEDNKILAAPKSKKKDPKATEQAADQLRRKAELFQELEKLVRDSESLLQDAGQEK
jgi:nucleoside-triphosphatase THEP1